MSDSTRLGRDFMIDESSLKYPIADYLTGLEFPLKKIKLEYPHPDLKKRRIDLVMTDDSGKNIESAFEFKLAQLATKYEPEQKRIFHDLVRLHLIAKDDTVECYFLISGTQSDFIQYFRSIVTTKPINSSKTLPEPEGIYTEWFNFELGQEKEFNIKGVIGNAYEPIYNSFLTEYEAKGKGDAGTLVLPDEIKTKCIAISAISRDFPTPYVGGIWQVK
jgi:hypothetical protein